MVECEEQASLVFHLQSKIVCVIQLKSLKMSAGTFKTKNGFENLNSLSPKGGGVCE